MYVIILLFVFFCFCFGPFFLYPCHSFPDGHFWFSLANDGTWILGYMKQINYAQTVENEERRWRGSGFVLEYICFVLVSIHELFFHCVYNLSLTSPLEYLYFQSNIRSLSVCLPILLLFIQSEMRFLEALERSPAYLSFAMLCAHLNG